MTLSLATAKATSGAPFGATTRRAPRSRAQMPPFAAYFAVWKQRRELAGLAPARLRDLGITPEQAADEAARPFWDLP